jgi:GNAT superfamily N-acetyltransferase
MIEIALEKFPVTCSLDDIEITIRPLQEKDESAFGEFFMAIPEEERLFIKHRITDGALFHEWCQEIDYEVNLPLLALAGDRIVGDGTLHQRSGGWKRHIGLVSVLTLPDFRGKGIVDLLIAEMVEIARHAGLAKLEAEFNGERKAGMKAFGKVGFTELVRLPDYVQDMHRNNHDYVLMGMDLIADEELLGAGD